MVPRPTDNDVDPAWYACYTMARREKKIHARLQEQGVESFLPVSPRVSQWHDRRKTIEWPLFPSYVFVRCQPRELSGIVALPGITDVVRFGRHPAVVPEMEIQNIALFAAALREHRLEPPACRFTEGQKVKILGGPFAGVTGIVVEARGGRRVVVGMPTLGMGFEVQVAAELVAPLRSPDRV